MKYDLYQKEVIKASNSNIMVVAGAGCGKTSVIIGRINYLIEILKIEPSLITVLSYTTKAVKELKERLKIPEVNISTIHSLAYHICKTNLNLDFKIIDENYLNKIIENYLNKEVPLSEQKSLNKYFKDKKVLKETIFKIINSDKKLIINETNQKAKYLENLIQKILNYYEIIKRKNNYYDYKDLLIKTLKELPNLKLSIKYLFVDEYQDLTDLKYEFIKGIKKITKAKLLVVGDDAQSIYGFNGSNINIFYNFKQDFENAKIYKLKYTYRFSKELILISSMFIEKNEKQIKKELLSTKNLDNPAIIKYYFSKNGKGKLLEKVINQMDETMKILVLGRYNFDINEILKNPNFKYQRSSHRIKYLKNLNYDITFLTIHSAKGLDYDEVILINNENDIYGFPSKIVNNIVQEDLQETRLEERRLFYVALTRTKNHIYCLVNIFHQSSFIKELNKIIKIVKHKQK